MAILMITLQLMLASCLTPYNCVKGDGQVEKRSFDLEEFDSFVVGCSADVELTQGEVQSVEIEGESNILELFNKEVNGGTWNIDTEKCYQTKKGVTVRITMKDLQNIKINGSGDVSSMSKFNTDDMKIEINGSGDVQLALDSEDIDAEIDGSGDVTLSGVCHSMDIDVNGSGDIKAFELKTGDCDIHINGSGDTRLHVSGHLTVKTNGSGDVHYKGEPKSVDVQDNGSGDVRDAN